MAMIVCEECGKEISSTAETCPHCGTKTKFYKKKDRTIAVYICYAAIAIGLFLLIPALVTLADNYNDWYFWNWYTERSNAVMQNIGMGVGLTGGGLGCLLGFRIRAKREAENSAETE